MIWDDVIDWCETIASEMLAERDRLFREGEFDSFSRMQKIADLQAAVALVAALKATAERASGRKKIPEGGR